MIYICVYILDIHGVLLASISESCKCCFLFLTSGNHFRVKLIGYLPGFPADMIALGTCRQGSFINKLSSTISSTSIQGDNLEGVGTLTKASHNSNMYKYDIYIYV